MDDYLSKPFTEAQLEQKLSKWCKQPAQEAIPGNSGPTRVVSAIAASQPPKPAKSKGGGRARNTPPARGAIATGTGSLDKDVLARLKNSHPGLLARLIETYLGVAPELLSQLAAAVAGKNRDALRAAAHSLKSSSANVGAAKLADLCRDLEHVLKTNPRADAKAWRRRVAGIEAELAAATKELAAVGETLREGTAVDGLSKARVKAN